MSSSQRPPIVLVHGAANSSIVWKFWRQELEALDWSTHAVDLRGHGADSTIDLSTVSMADYADDVVEAITRLGRAPILMGWSMGGLVAMMVAAGGQAVGYVGLAPSLPATSVDESLPLRTWTFGPEEYGITSREISDQPMMPDLDAEERTIALSSLGLESRLARDERKRGIVITDLPCPALIVTGELDTEWPRERYADLHLPADRLGVKAASHWGLVLNRRAIARAMPVVSDWLANLARD